MADTIEMRPDPPSRCEIALREFRHNVRVLTGQEAHSIRNRYMKRFVDINSEYYKHWIENKQQYPDGRFYSGYLWDALRKVEQIGMSNILSSFRGDELIYAFWDVHSDTKVFISNYWVFPKDAVLQTDYGTLLMGLAHLPQDIYVTDIMMEESVVFTHEHDDNGKMYVVKTS